MNIYDVNGIPIYPGDLLRSFHFSERGGKNRYLWHVAVKYGDTLQMVPVRYLDPAVREAAIASGLPSGQCVLTQEIADGLEVVHGLCAVSPGTEPIYHDERVRGPSRIQRALLNAEEESIH